MTVVYLKYLLILLCFVLGGVLHAQLGFSQAWYLYVGGVVLLLFQVLMGNVWTAYSHLKRGRPIVAERMLKQVWNPKWLIRRNRAYYYFCNGLIALQQKEMERAADQLQLALDIGMEHPNDSGLASLNLAHIYFVQHNWEQSEYWMEKARSFSINDLMIKEKLKELEQAIAAQKN
jgi:tetratricopeptide (TPR) repeat protein